MPTARNATSTMVTTLRSSQWDSSCVCPNGRRPVLMIDVPSVVSDASCPSAAASAPTTSGASDDGGSGSGSPAPSAPRDRKAERAAKKAERAAAREAKKAERAAKLEAKRAERAARREARSG